MSSENPPFPANLRGARGKKLGLAIAVALSAAGIMGAARFKRPDPPAAAESPTMKMEASAITLTPGAPQFRLLQVGEVKAAGAHYGYTVPARVTIDETRAAKVGSPLTGRVTQVFVELGQAVKAGDPLFSVASPDIAGLRIERDRAAVDLDLAKTQLSRIKAMVQAQALPAKDELEATQQLRQADLALRLAQSKFSSLKVSSKADNEFTVIAPRDGTVVEKTVLPSQEVGPDSAVVSVVDLSEVWVVADLFEADAMGIRQGTKARLSSPSIPGLAIETTVEMVSAVVDPVRHTVPVRMRVTNEGGRLKPNIFAEAKFELDPVEGAVEVPASAVISNGVKRYVYVQEAPGKFARRDVTAGSQRDGAIPVFAGLRLGESVVEAGAILLENQVLFSN